MKINSVCIRCKKEIYVLRNKNKQMDEILEALEEQHRHHSPNCCADRTYFRIWVTKENYDGKGARI